MYLGGERDWPEKLDVSSSALYASQALLFFWACVIGVALTLRVVRIRFIGGRAICRKKVLTSSRSSLSYGRWPKNPYGRARPEHLTDISRRSTPSWERVPTNSLPLCDLIVYWHLGSQLSVDHWPLDIWHANQQSSCIVVKKT